MDPMIALLVSIMLGFSVVLIFVGLSTPSKPSLEQERLQTYGTRPRTLTEMELSQPFSERVILPIVKNMASLVKRFTPQRSVEEVRLKLDLAGNPNNWTPSDFLGVRGLVAFIALALTALLLFVLKFDPLRIALFGAIAAFLGFYLPMFWLNSKIRARKHEIEKSLPDALDMLTIGVEAGLGLDAAMVKVAEKWNNELSRAFGRANTEIRLGKLRREALRDMAIRADVPSLTNFISAVIQADQLGVSLAKVLRIQSEQMRVRQRQRAEEAAAQAPVKMMFPLVFLIFPSIFIVLLGPAALIFMESNPFG
jgi:tight adherence protein C